MARVKPCQKWDRSC